MITIIVCFTAGMAVGAFIFFILGSRKISDRDEVIAEKNTFIKAITEENVILHEDKGFLQAEKKNLESDLRTLKVKYDSLKSVKKVSSNFLDEMDKFIESHPIKLSTNPKEIVDEMIEDFKGKKAE